jgi:hypothetical protein
MVPQNIIMTTIDNRVIQFMMATIEDILARVCHPFMMTTIENIPNG